MIGSFLSRVLLMIFGYAYPAYECFKSVEKQKPEVLQLQFWCQYWLPFYSEIKLGVFIYLWHPKTKGTAYVFNSFFQPYMAKHETEIDGRLLKLRNEIRQVLPFYWQRAVFCCYKIYSEFIKQGTSQSTLKPDISMKNKESAQVLQSQPSS